MIPFLTENWPVIVGSLCVGVSAASVFWKFYNTPRAQQVEQVKLWLMQAVTEAEKKYGSKTGQQKLSYVYDLFIQRFPALAKVLTYEQFNGLVDEVLKRFQSMLSSNKELREYVEAS